MVAKRQSVATELRRFISSGTADSATVIALSERYGELDGEMSYYYATVFTQVWNTMTSAQKAQLSELAGKLGYIDPPGGFLYSEPIAMPEIMNTDFMFK
jgi:Spy/CpxP family protein refolding chaperone